MYDHNSWCNLFVFMQLFMLHLKSIILLTININNQIRSSFEVSGRLIDGIAQSVYNLIQVLLLTYQWRGQGYSVTSETQQHTFLKAAVKDVLRSRTLRASGR